MMKTHFFVVLVFLSFAYVWSLPAFPGAEGWGANSRGGRSGAIIQGRAYDTRVVHVTNLNTTGAGSFAQALAAGGPTMIVFDVSGVINLNNTNLTINSWTTVAGQTSPGGITLINGGLLCRPTTQDDLFGTDWPCTYDVIVRHLRIRSSRWWGGDDNVRMEYSRDVIFDHCSFTNCCDEIVDYMWSYNVTHSWCVMAESNVECGGEVHWHGYQGTMTDKHSLINCYFAHHDSRVPLLSNCYYSDRPCVPYSGTFEVINNAIYNCSASQTFVRNTNPVNLIGNYTKAGKNASGFFRWGSGGSSMKVYAEGNYSPSNPSAAQTSFVNGPTWSNTVLQPAHFTMDYTDGQQACQDIVAGVGPFPRDSCDRRLIHEMQTGTGQWRNLNNVERSTRRLIPRDPLTLPKFTKPADTDNDGMPDYWEVLHGLDPNDGTDYKTPMNGGYDAIEVFVNELSDTLVAKGQWPATLSVDEAYLVSQGNGLTVHPNPFNGQTRLTFKLGNKQSVAINIYNLNGRLVSKVVDGERAEGRHFITLKTDGLAPGLYLARLHLGSKTLTSRLMLLK
jgi:hypothetical protein